MKKVLFTATVDSHILQFHIPYLKMFKENGYEVHVATNGIEEIPYCDKKHVISFERNPMKINNLKAIKELKKIIEKEKFDIIHCHTPMGAVVTRLAAKKARRNGTRVIYTAHGFHFYKGAPIKNWLIFYPVEKWLAKYTDCLITINNEDYTLAKKKFLKRCKDIEYVPGVGIDKLKFDFSFTEKEKIELRKSIGLDKEDFVIIYPAELSKRKRQEWLINSISELLKENEKIKLLLPGKDSLNGKCQELVKKVGLEKQIKFLGYRKDIPKLLKISDLSISSAKQEGLPVNLMEAMYLGLPIVASDCRGNRDLVQDQKNGFLVKLNDQERYSSVIEKIYQDRTIRNKFGREGEKIIQNYLLDEISKKMFEIYFKKKKILHLLSSNIYSGAENIACSIIDNMSEKYEMVYCSPSGQIDEILKTMDIKHAIIKKMSYFELKKIIKQYQPDIVHAHDFKASILMGIINYKGKIISQIHKNDPKVKKVSIKSILYLISSKKFSRIIFVSEKINEEYVYNKYIIKKVRILNNTVNKNMIIKLAHEKQVKKYDCCYVGRLAKEKNPLFYIDIIKKISKEYPQIKAIMIGDGELRDECSKKILTLKLKENIEMVGFQKNPYPYLLNSKVCIMPSLYEGFGIVAIESLALGTPVLNSGNGELKNIFSNDLENLICYTDDEYVRKYIELEKNKKINYDSEIEKYTNVEEWKKIIENTYEEGD